MSTLLLLVIGIFIGWNLPQPDWARSFQHKLLEMSRGLTSK